MDTEKNAEERIFESAQRVFFEKGYDGARMQEIADAAGINKSMLHYYYRSKDKLFEGVFRTSLMDVIAPAIDLLSGPLPLRDKIERFIHLYIDQLRANPHVPAFVLYELGRHPERLRQFIGEHAQRVFPGFAAQIEEAVRRGEVKPVQPRHLVVNLIGLCIFPFIARPIIETGLGMDEEAYEVFLQERKQEVTAFMFNALGL